VNKLTVDGATRFTKVNKHALHFMMGAQAAIFEEMVYAGYELLDRTRIEMHLFSEFVAKTAAAHSAKDIRTMCGECSQHQIDFVRCESERLFKHGERMIETTSKLFGNRSQDGLPTVMNNVKPSKEGAHGPS
jgi:hypothetical protein